jgi:hypothetical protein
VVANILVNLNKLRDSIENWFYSLFYGHDILIDFQIKIKLEFLSEFATKITFGYLIGQKCDSYQSKMDQILSKK